MNSIKYSTEDFLKSCGIPGPLRLSIADGSRPTPVIRDLLQPFIVVGRDPNTDLTLDNWRVSRRHCYLQLIGGRLFCIDLGSRTGTQWSDGNNRSGWLDFDLSIRIGPYEISRVPHDANENQHDSKFDEHEASYFIEILQKTAQPTRIKIEGELTIVGSSPECRVHLPFSDVSKAHCSLVRSNNGLWVVDLFGRGGVRLGGRSIRFARLDEGDELRIGRHLLRFVEDSSKSSQEAIVTTPPREVHDLALSAPMSLPVASWQYPEDEAARILAERPASQAELVQALMQPMVQQFGLMQQQMFEQFHQAMMGMFQSFGSFYRDQMKDLREELEEVRRLTEELKNLQIEARAREIATTLIAPVSPPPATVLSEGRLHADRQTPVEMPRQPAEKPVETEPSVRKPPQKTDPGVHGVLFSRIAQLQTERQTRWQKILAMMNRTPE